MCGAKYSRKCGGKRDADTAKQKGIGYHFQERIPLAIQLKERERPQPRQHEAMLVMPAEQIANPKRPVRPWFQQISAFGVPLIVDGDLTPEVLNEPKPRSDDDEEEAKPHRPSR